jgi:hypothetical protein
MIHLYEGGYFQFSLVFIKKIIKPKLFKIKNQNRTKTGSNRPVSVWFFRTKPVQSGLARFFPVWLGLFLFGFDFFGFRLIKSKPNQTGRFFQNFYQFNRVFFHGSIFLVICFSNFLGLIGFSVFLLTPTFIHKILYFLHIFLFITSV